MIINNQIKIKLLMTAIDKTLTFYLLLYDLFIFFFYQFGTGKVGVRDGLASSITPLSTTLAVNLRAIFRVKGNGEVSQDYFLSSFHSKYIKTSKYILFSHIQPCCGILSAYNANSLKEASFLFPHLYRLHEPIASAKNPQTE